MKPLDEAFCVPHNHRLELCWSSCDVRHRDAVYLPAPEATTPLEALDAPTVPGGDVANALIPRWNPERVIEVALAGLVVCNFSNRWFPPKATHIWPALHDFERLGLVQALLLESGMFQAVGGCSSAGVPRPPDDPYRDRLSLSDPVYAVWGMRND